MTTKDPSFMDRIGEVKNGAPSDYDKVKRIYQCGEYKNFVAPPVKLASSASTTNEGSCVNVDCMEDYCPTAIDHCETNRDYMRKYCPKSCNFCSAAAAPTPAGPTPGCKDLEADCATLARDGHCQKSNGWTEYMAGSCPKSCGLCSG